MQMTLHLHQEDGQIHCQFGWVTMNWCFMGRWYEWGCREVVVSDTPNPEGRGQHLRREVGEICVFQLDCGVPEILLPIEGHPALNELSELWIWPLVPVLGQHPASRLTDTASKVLAA